MPPIPDDDPRPMVMVPRSCTDLGLILVTLAGIRSRTDRDLHDVKADVDAFLGHAALADSPGELVRAAEKYVRPIVAHT